MSPQTSRLSSGGWGRFRTFNTNFDPLNSSDGPPVTGEPNSGFLLNALKTLFRVSRVRKNCFPSSVIDRIISRHLAKSYNPSPTHNATLNSGKPSSHYFKLPYVGRFSDIAQTKLRQLLKRYCRPDLDIKLVFNTFKLRNLFSVKDSVPPGLRSRVVYKFFFFLWTAVHIDLKSIIGEGRKLLSLTE